MLYKRNELDLYMSTWEELGLTLLSEKINIEPCIIYAKKTATTTRKPYFLCLYLCMGMARGWS